ncbi:MAG: hypothetical protein K8R06_07680, partial [Methanosarcinales archaeon]|nr:hypothetical protein [Methanosarcinales archaeon]MCD4816265.1 hypothetical protein [Methanosarcinales archaeon]
SIDRWVEQTTTFVLRATKDAEISDVRTVIVTVEDETADLPIIHYFVADPAGISAGGKSTLRWEVSGATSIAIDGIGKVDPTGEIIVDPDETTIYILRATNEAGINVETVAVNVDEQPPILSVDPDPPSFDFELTTVLNFWGANTRTFSVDNSGGGDLFWTIETTRDWITIEPTYGYNSETITLKIITTGLEPDEYEGNIYIKSNYGTSRGYISLILVDGSMSDIMAPSNPRFIE